MAAGQMSDALRGSFTDMCAREVPGLHRFAVAVAGNPTRADDLVQAALERVYVVWPRVHGLERPGAYLRTVLVRLALREQRHSRWRREQTTAEVPDLDRRDFEASAVDRLDLTALLASLTVKQRAVLVLRYGEDRSVAEVASLLGVSQGTVKRRTFDALNLLRQRAGHPAPTSPRRTS